MERYATSSEPRTARHEPRRNVTILLIAITALGAWLRLRQLSVPSFWLDEILDYDIATAASKQALWRWLGVFQLEHGPLFYATELAGRWAHTAEMSARLAPALFGIATIPAIWFAARIFSDRTAAFVAAILLAVSPLHIYYSREARPYAMTLLITTLVLIVLLRGAPVGAWIAIFALAFYSSATTAPIAISAAVAALMIRQWRVAGVAFTCAILTAACYRPATHLGHADFPHLNTLLQSFSVAALDASRPHRAAYVFALLAAVGAVALFRRNRPQAIVLITMTILPIAIPVAAAWRMHHFFAIRYAIAALPSYLLLTASGLSAILQPLRRWRADIIASVVAAALLTRSGWDVALNEPFRKLDWRTVARTISRHSHANDAVIAANDWTAISLGFYLRGLSPPIRLFNANGSETLGEVFAYQNTTSWIVLSEDFGSPFAAWACRFPVLLANPLENFRLHYSPNAYYFLTDRSTPAEHRALLASFSGGAPSIHFAPGDHIFLGDGWSGAEAEEGGYARWAIGHHAFIALPVGEAGNRLLTIDMASASKSQSASLSLNDQEIGNIALQTRQRHVFAGVFHAGVNILRFDFQRATAPADVDPRSSDHRPLAARVYEVTIDNGGPGETHVLRLDQAETYVSQGRPLPANVDGAKLAHFVGRLGFDPQRAILALTPGRATLANLATTIADDSSCMDNEQFLRTLFPALLGREVTDRELREFTTQLEKGVSRATIAWRLGNSDEVRAQLVSERESP